MNQYKIWQIILIYSVLVFGILYALPNFYPTKPAIQIAFGDTAKLLNTNVKDELSKVLSDKEIAFNEINIEENSAKVIFDDVENQLSGRRVLADYSEGDFIIALNSEPSTPEWLNNIGGKPINLGLDLAGGIHFLLEVDTERYSTERLSSEGASFIDEFRNRNINANYTSNFDEINITFLNQNDVSKARDYLEQNNFTTSGSKFAIIQNDSNISLQYTDNYLSEIVDYAVEQNLVALRNRVNELGVSEPIVQREGKGRIVVELPGVQDSASAKKIIGKTANLEFRLEARPTDSFLRKDKFTFKNSPSRSAFLEKVIVISGDNVTNAQSSFDENGRPQVNINLDIDGGRAMQNATKDNIGRRLGVVLVEEKTKTFFDEQDNVIQETYLEKSIISNATIQAALGTSFRITGLTDSYEASELALLLRAGALAAPMKFVKNRLLALHLDKKI